MSRLSVAAFFSFAIILFSAQFAFAATQNSSDSQCPAPKPPTSKYAGPNYAATYTIPDPSNPDKTITVTNLSKKSCTQTCATDGGGTINGTCAGPSNCVTKTQCNSQPVKKPPSSGTSGQQTSPVVTALPPVTVEAPGSSAQDGQAANTQTGESVPQNTAGTQGSTATNNTDNSTPNTSNSAAQAGTSVWTGGAASQGSLSPNSSLFTQALNSLEGNSSAPGSGQPAPVTVPTTPQAYLQTTFDTAPTGAVANTNPGPASPNADGATASINNPLNLNPTPWSPSSPLGWASQEQLNQLANCNNCTLQLSQSSQVPNGNAPFMLQAAPGQVSSALANAINENGGWVTGVLTQQSEQQVSVTVEPQTTPAATPTETPTAQPETPQQQPTADANQSNQTNSNASQQQQAAQQQNSTSAQANAGSQSSQTQQAPNNQAAQQSPSNPASAQQSPSAQQQANAGPPSGQPANTAGGSSAAQNSGGATGGSQNNSGGPSNASSVLSGLLSGLSQAISGSVAPIASGQPHASAPIVAAPNQPLVSSPTQTVNGDQLTPCVATSPSTQQTQTPCNVSSTAPLSGAQLTPLSTPHLVASLSTGSSNTSGQGSTGSGQGAIQTIISGSVATQGSTQTTSNTQQSGKAQTSGSSQASASQSGPANQSGSGAQPAKTSSQTSGGSNAGTANNAPGNSGTGNNTPANPAGTQPGATGTANPSGSQQGGTGAPATAPGNSSSQPNSNALGQSPPAQPTPQTTCGFTCKIGNAIAYVAKNPGILFGISPANATEITQNDINNLKSAAQKLENGVRAFANTRAAGSGTTPGNNAIKAGLSAAHYLENNLGGAIAGDLRNFQVQSALLEQSFSKCVPASQAPEAGIGLGQGLCLAGQQVRDIYDGGAASLNTMAGVVDTKGQQLVQEVNHAVAQIRPNTGFSNLGTPAGQAQVVPIANNAQNQPNPNPIANPDQNNPVPAAPASQSQPTGLVAKVAPITGAASGYDCRLGGINGNCAQNGTGGFVNPGEYSAALRLNLAKTFQVGTGAGNVGYALVENTATGKQMIVKVNDNGPLDPGGTRVIDLSPASMNCLGFNDCTNDPALHSTVLPSVKVTLLQGSYTPGVVANGVLPTGPSCNYRGCAAPTPNPQVAAARVPTLTSL